jgi:hypothetical protein
LSRDVTTKSVRSLPHCEQRWGDFELSTRREKTVQPRHRFGGGDSHDQAAPVTKAQSEGHPAAIAIAGVAALRDQIAAAEGQAEATKEASPEDGSIGVTPLADAAAEARALNGTGTVLVAEQHDSHRSAAGAFHAGQRSTRAVRPPQPSWRIRARIVRIDKSPRFMCISESIRQLLPS